MDQKQSMRDLITDKELILACDLTTQVQLYQQTSPIDGLGFAPGFLWGSAGGATPSGSSDGSTPGYLGEPVRIRPLFQLHHSFGWKMVTAAHWEKINQSNDYMGVILAHEEKKLLLLAHREMGSVSNIANCLNIALNRYIPISKDAIHMCQVALKLIDTPKYRGYTLCHTGFSMGGFLAQITATACHHMRHNKYPNELFNEAICYDSPGVADAINHFKWEDNRSNIIIYLTSPNLVNTGKQHYGYVRQIVQWCDTNEYTGRFRALTVDNPLILFTHKLVAAEGVAIVESLIKSHLDLFNETLCPFNAENNYDFKHVKSWPIAINSFNYKQSDTKTPGISKSNGAEEFVETTLNTYLENKVRQITNEAGVPELESISHQIKDPQVTYSDISFLHGTAVLNIQSADIKGVVNPSVISKDLDASALQVGKQNKETQNQNPYMSVLQLEIAENRLRKKSQSEIKNEQQEDNSSNRLKNLVSRLKSGRDFSKIQEFSNFYQRRENAYQKGIKDLMEGNDEISIQELTKAANEDHPAACIWLHFIYFQRSKTIKLDELKEKAESLIKYLKERVIDEKSNIKDDVESDLLFCLFWCYRNGLGFDRDNIKAEGVLSRIQHKEIHRYIKRIFPEKRTNDFSSDGDLQEFDVPSDGTCLFYCVMFSVLLPVVEDKNAFEEMFIYLFGNEVIDAAEESRKLLLSYDGSSDFIKTNSAQLEVLADINFRRRVVEFIRNHKKDFEDFYDTAEGFEERLKRVEMPKTWGGEEEIQAISAFLKRKIIVWQDGTVLCSYGESYEDLPVHLAFVSASGYEEGAKNHYHFKLAISIYKKSIKSTVNLVTAHRAGELNYYKGENEFLACHFEAAHDFFIKAAHERYIAAFLRLHVIYARGDMGYAKNEQISKAFLEEIIDSFGWFQEEAEKGSPDALYNLAYLYDKGKLVRCNDNEAVRHYTLSAEKNYPPAQCELALYMTKKGTRNLGHEAQELFSKCSDLHGYYLAEYYLGLLSDSNNFKDKAFRYYKKAADKGYPLAQHNLAMGYMMGEWGKINEKMAFEYFKLASLQNYSGSQNSLGVLYKKGNTIIEKDEKKAFEYFNLSAEQLNLMGLKNLGFCYKDGIGVDKNEKKAGHYFALAEKVRSDSAQKSYVEQEENPLPGTYNPVFAIRAKPQQNEILTIKEPLQPNSKIQQVN